MRIKFIAPDPRAGDVAQMDSHRGQDLINQGSAFQIKEDGSEDGLDAPVPVQSADQVAAVLVDAADTAAESGGTDDAASPAAATTTKAKTAGKK